MWHGAGDWSASAPMERMRRVIEENTPNGTYVYSVVIGSDGGGNIVDGVSALLLAAKYRRSMDDHDTMCKKYQDRLQLGEKLAIRILDRFQLNPGLHFPAAATSQYV